MAKKYSVTDRLRFHQARVNNPQVSENKRWYSRNWLEGYHDWHAKNNYSAVCSEIEYKKRNKCLKESAPGLFGYKNGLAAQLSEKNKMK